jgi:hypothetical protein
MLPGFIAALRATPPSFPPGLRVKRVQGTSGAWEVTFASDGRATFEKPLACPDARILPATLIAGVGGCWRVSVVPERLDTAAQEVHDVVDHCHRLFG